MEENLDLLRFLESLSHVTEGMSSGANKLVFDVRNISRPCTVATMMIQEVVAQRGVDLRILASS